MTRYVCSFSRFFAKLIIKMIVSSTNPIRFWYATLIKSLNQFELYSTNGVDARWKWRRELSSSYCSLSTSRTFSFFYKPNAKNNLVQIREANILICLKIDEICWIRINAYPTWKGICNRDVIKSNNDDAFFCSQSIVYRTLLRDHFPKIASAKRNVSQSICEIIENLKCHCMRIVIIECIVESTLRENVKNSAFSTASSIARYEQMRHLLEDGKKRTADKGKRGE